MSTIIVSRQLKNLLMNIEQSQTRKIPTPHNNPHPKNKSGKMFHERNQNNTDKKTNQSGGFAINKLN